MSTFNRVSTAVFSFLVGSSFAYAAEAFNPEQTSAIEKIVHDYMVKHPQVLVEASAALQKQQQADMQTNAKAAILTNADKLLAHSLTVSGNPKGNVTLIEFFDYQCGHCQHMKPVLSQLTKSDTNLRVVYKEFPIFGKSSELASKAALAAANQDKYMPMQAALFSLDKPITEQAIIEKAKQLGLNIEQFKKDMTSAVVAEALAQNRALAEKMSLMGTPAFIVVSTPDGKFNASHEPVLIPGAANLETLQAAVKKVSA